MKTTRLERDSFQLQEAAQGDLLIYFSADCHRFDSFNTELLHLRRLGRRRKLVMIYIKTNSELPYQSMRYLAEPLPTGGKPAEYRTRKMPIAPVVRLRTRGKYKTVYWPLLASWSKRWIEAMTELTENMVVSRDQILHTTHASEGNAMVGN